MSTRRLISELYQEYLGRDGFAVENGKGIDFWQDQLDGGHITQDQLIQKFKDSDEAIAYNYAESNRQPIGLEGQEAALNDATTSALEKLDQSFIQGRQDIQAGSDNALATLGPNIEAGQDASALLAALSGASGSTAQQQAYDNFNSSPGQQYLVDQSERALTRNSAATGGLAGGRLLQALQENATGLARQDFGDSFNRTATTAQLNNPFVQQGATIQAGTGTNLGNASLNNGQQAGQYAVNNGALISQARGQAGRDIASVSQGVGQNIANLGMQQGQSVSDLFGQGGASLANILSQTGQMQSGATQSLLNLLSGVSMTQPNLQAIPGKTQTQGNLGQLGNLASGLGSAYSAFSDIKLKKNIHQVGQTEDGTAIYEWDWETDAPDAAKQQIPVGVIAQEVMKTQPSAVARGDDGYLRVDYNRVT